MRLILAAFGAPAITEAWFKADTSETPPRVLPIKPAAAMCRYLRKSSPVSQASTGVVEMNILGHANRLLFCSRVWGSNCELRPGSSTGVAPLGWTVRTASLFQMHFGPSGKSLLKRSWRTYFSVEPRDSRATSFDGSVEMDLPIQTGSFPGSRTHR
jgi:hypothetical protein